MKKITLYVDIVSPFAYVAYEVLRHDPIFKECEITYIPIFLGGVMKTAGNTPPIQIKNKDKWILAERARWSRYFNVPTVSHPPKFPAMTLTVMRVICALAHLTGAPQTSAAAQRAITAAVDAFYEAHWGQARDVTDKDVIADVLGKTLPLLLPASGGGGNTSKEEAVARVLGVAGTEGKRILLENTDEAFRQGAFGLPWMVCENDRGEKEGFWGVDHMGVMLDFLGIQKPRTGPWKALL